MAEQKLDLIEFTACRMAKPRTRSPKIVRSELVDAGLFRKLLHQVPDYFFCKPVAQVVPARVTRRKIFPVVIPAVSSHSSIRSLTQSGIGIVRM